ncbi:Crp/Fnr family transcriptional regulator [Fluviicola sp.]|uniref:Crp/Fnr family transcriptional regulator n=1 Tax=Fluviicola sp. TaxID=1917219 RepID=UPI0031CF6FD5
MQQLRKHIEEITPVSDEEFDYINSLFIPKRVRKNQYLIHEGDEVKQDFFVLSGLYKVFFADAEGKEHILQFARENWWMSDYRALFHQKEASLYIECIEAGEVLSFSLHARETLCAEMHKMEHFFRTKLSNGYVSLQQRIKLLLSSSPQERYEEFARLYPDLLQKLPKKMIAEYLGVSRETLSRLYSR